jgi:glycosyltransferase involved in cell wall biosynthesis
MAKLYYDLSEQFLASGSRFKYYGISRTVMEVGYELAKSGADIGFVIFSPAHDRFFEVSPRIGRDSPTGVLDPNVPHEATPIRLRHSFPKPNRLRDKIYPLVHWIVRKANLKRWRSIPKGTVREVDLSGQVLVSLGRPKIMVDYITSLGEGFEKIRFFPLLHDMIPLYELTQPNQSLFSSNFAHDNHIVVRCAEAVLSNSAFTKTEIERFVASGHLPQTRKVTAVPLAHQLRPTDEPIEIKLPERPYLLSVGILTGRKNLECAMAALLHLHKTGRPVPDFCLAGARRKRAEAYINRSEFADIRSKIHYMLNPNQSELRVLYQKSLALLIPSHLEGWGLPLGEALWLGTPGLASTAPALQEVGGSLARYFVPDDPIVLAGLIDQLASDPAFLREEKTRIARGHYMLRSWGDVAQDLLKAVG